MVQDALGLHEIKLDIGRLETSHLSLGPVDDSPKGRKFSAGNYEGDRYLATTVAHASGESDVTLRFATNDPMASQFALELIDGLVPCEASALAGRSAGESQ
jgi:hypothetical protein